MDSLKHNLAERTWGERLQSRWMLLMGAGLLILFSNGRWIIPLAAWLVPILIVRYFRRVPRLWEGILCAWILLFVTTPILWLGLWPFPLPVILQITAIGSALSLLPYLLDRLTHDRFKGIAQTLVFPSAAVAVEFLGSLRSGTTWGNIAYTQTDNLAFLQLASITGLWGMMFVMLWLAPVLNNLWDQGFTSKRGRSPLLIYAAILGAILLFGSLRLVFFNPTLETLRVSTVSPPEFFDLATPRDLEVFQQIMTKQPVEPDEADTIRNKLSLTSRKLFADTRREAEAGADVVSWPEGALISFDEVQDRKLIDEARELAKEQGIFLVMTIALVPFSAEDRNENRLLLIDPEGEVLATYWKTYTVPVVEEPFAVRGSHRVAVQETRYGRFGGVICADMDAARFLHGAGQQNTDLLFAPSGDWPAIKELHPRMSIMRAVEQGFSLVRPANHGLTLAVDYQGRILGRMDHYSSSDRRMSVLVPQNGTTTLYSRIGDLFSWLCVAASVFFLARMAPFLLTGWRRTRFQALAPSSFPSGNPGFPRKARRTQKQDI